MELIQLMSIKKPLAPLAILLLAVTLLMPSSVIFAQEPIATSVIEGLPAEASDYEKLQTLDYFINQLLIEHNEVAKLAKNDWDKYGARFLTYAHFSKAQLKKMLNEKAILKDKILWANYTEKEWRQIRDLELYDQLYFGLYGDKEAHYNIKLSPMVISPVLEDLKSINLDTLKASTLPPDPTEDLTTYTEVDPGTYISRTADQVTFTELDRDINAYLYDDKSADYFDGDFEHLLRCMATDVNGAGIANVWGLANLVDDAYAIRTANGDILNFRFYSGDGISLVNDLFEIDSGTLYFDRSSALAYDTEYYIEVERDEAVGTYGTLYAYISTGGYWDDGGVQIDSLSLTLHTSKKDYRYVYACQSYNTATGNRWLSGYAKFLDLQEGGAPPPPPELQPPTNLKLTVLNDTEIEATWPPSETANVTYLLLVATADYPNDPLGNFAVAYSGNQTTATLTGYDMELTTNYFSLWTHTNPYSEEYTTALIGGEEVAEQLGSMNEILTSIVMLLPLAFISAMAFWHPNPILFILAGACAVFNGFNWYDALGTHEALAIGLMLIAYGFVCFAFAYRYIFYREEG